MANVKGKKMDPARDERTMSLLRINIRLKRSETEDERVIVSGTAGERNDSTEVRKTWENGKLSDLNRSFVGTVPTSESIRNDNSRNNEVL
jgi:hypothetical protein